MHEILINIIAAVITLVVIPLIGLGGTALVNLIQHKVKNEKLKNSLTAATNIVQNSVEMVAQTYVKQARLNGGFDEEHKKEALNKAVSNIKELISSDIRQTIEKHFMDFDKWIITLIESYIQNKKTAGTI